MRDVEDVLAQCAAAGTPVFLKQLGSNVHVPIEMDPAGFFPVSVRVSLLQDMPDDVARVYLNDKKGGDWSEWPERFRVRQLPEVLA